MRQREQDVQAAIRSSLQRDNVIHQEMETNEDMTEPVLDEGVAEEPIFTLEQDEPVTNMFFQEKVKNRNKKQGILCWLLLLLFIRS